MPGGATCLLLLLLLLPTATLPHLPPTLTPAPPLIDGTSQHRNQW